MDNQSLTREIFKQAKNNLSIYRGKLKIYIFIKYLIIILTIDIYQQLIIIPMIMKFIY